MVDDHTYEYVDVRRPRFDWIAVGALGAAVAASGVGAALFASLCS